MNKLIQIGCVLLMAFLGAQAQTIYSCNFDKNDCGVRIVETDVKFFTISERLQDDHYFFTDATSITAATDNKKPCTIPFNLDSIQYYHCTPEGMCQTSSGVYGKCATGRFLNGIGGFSAGGAYTARSYFPAFELPEEGNYTLTLKAFMFCDGPAADCAKSTETFDIFINQETPNANIEVRELRLKDFGGSKAWKTFTVNFRFIKSKIFINIDVAQFNNINTIIYYGIDDITVTGSKPSGNRSASYSSASLLTLLVGFVVSMIAKRLF